MNQSECLTSGHTGTIGHLYRPHTGAATLKVRVDGGESQATLSIKK